MKTILRFEGLCVLILGTIIYLRFSFDFYHFLIFFFTPDITLLGYFVNKKIGAILYNISHSNILPLILLAYAILFANPFTMKISIIWLCHIGFDRALGFGLKSEDSFFITHLGNIKDFSQK